MLSFPEELPSLVVSRVVDAVRPIAIAGGLFKEEAVNALMIQIGPGGAQSPSSSSQSGTAFLNMRGPQVAQSLNVTKDSIRFQTADYTRWIALRDQLEQILSASFPILAQSTNLHSVGLEYVDFFYGVSEGPEDVGMIIDNQSQLIAKRAFRKRDPFHSHAGWFESESEESRILVNVDVTVADAIGPEGQRRAITIRTYEAEQVLEMLSPRASELMDPVNVLAALDVRHRSLKARLGNILTRDAKSMISLGN